MKPKETIQRRLTKRRRARVELDCSTSRLKRLEASGHLTPIKLAGGRDISYPSWQIDKLVEGEVK